MFKNFAIACSFAFALAAPAQAQVFESFDSSSFLGSGLVGIDSRGVSLNTGGGDLDVNARLGPGGVSGTFGGDGYGGSFGNGGISVGTDSGFGGTYNGNGGVFSGPGGINGTIGGGGVTIGGGGFPGFPGGGFPGGGFPGGGFPGGGYPIGSGSPSIPGGGGRFNGSGSESGEGINSSGAQGEMTHSNIGGTRGFQTGYKPSFGRTLKGNRESIVGPDLQLGPTTTKGLAKVFGY